MKITLFNNPTDVWRPSPRNPREYPFVLYISIGTGIIDLHFVADSLGLFWIFFWWAPYNDFISARVTFQPFKVIQGHWFWYQSKARMDFLLVPHSNLGHILHSFGDFARFLCSWLHPYSTLILGVFPLHQMAHVGMNDSRDLKLFGREIIFEVFRTVWKTYRTSTSRTDRQTDRRTDRQTTCNLITLLSADSSRTLLACVLMTDSVMPFRSGFAHGRH